MEDNSERWQYLRSHYHILYTSEALYIQHKDEYNKEYDIIYTCIEHSYGHNTYYVYKRPPELSDHDLLIVADEGNLCFGGSASGNTLVVYTD